MKPWKLAAFLASAVLALAGPALAQEDTEQNDFTKSSSEFDQSFDSAIDMLAAKGFGDRLKSPALFAMSNTDFQMLVTSIKAETPISPLGRGDSAVIYDVILQPGHYGRKVGKVGTSGKLVSERALVGYVTARVADELRQRGHSVLVVSADDYIRDNLATTQWEGLRAKAFMSIHADGSVKKCSTGPSLGYSPGTSPFAMHAIGWGMAQALGYSYETFRKDNFTANEAKYYMFKNVESSTLEGLLEIGELTCEKSEKAMVEHAKLLATNIANSIDFILNTPKPAP